MAATIVDIAELCGYSKATVSRAFATPESVSEKARERIYAAAKELNYAPNVIAGRWFGSGLKTSRSSFMKSNTLLF